MASASSFSLASTGATARSRARRAAPTARADRVWQATPGGGLPGFREFYTSFEERGSGHPDSRFRASPRILDKWTVSKNRLGPSRIQIPRLAPDFGTLDRFQDPDIAMQNPDYAPRPAIWKLKDKKQIPDSGSALSISAPVPIIHQGVEHSRVMC